MKNKQVIFFGTPNFVIPVLEELVQNFTVVAVVTTPDALAGRKKILTLSPVKVAAQKHQIPVFTPQKMSLKHADPDLINQLTTLRPDISVIASYGKLIPEQIIDLPKYGSLNIHPSRLPEFRGPTPVPASILAGVTNSAVTIIKVDTQMDHGPILTQKELTITPVDTSESLLKRAFELGAKILIPTIQSYISGEINALPQDDTKATFCQLMTKEAGYFDLENPPPIEALDRMIRAYYPWPTAWTKWNGKVVKFLPNELIQIEGKNPTPLRNFLNGYPDFPLHQL